jgi:hypothetical protein
MYVVDMETGLAQAEWSSGVVSACHQDGWYAVVAFNFESNLKLKTLSL